MAFSSAFVLVIFGATGDLTHRKLMPALYRLAAGGEITPTFFIVGCGRRKLTQGQFAEMMARAVQDSVGNKFDLSLWRKILKGIVYQEGYFEEHELYQNLIKVLAKFDDQMKACVQRFFYLATPPQNYETILKHLETSKLSEGCGQGTNLYTKVLIEKPFGKDLTTARSLDELLAKIFAEKQIFRIDHYLGKETVQNLLAFRFANGIFEPTWNHRFIDHVQITLGESEGIGGRGAFYDGVGALRDVVQNHMLQMLALVAMEQPAAFDATSIRGERAKVLKSIIPIEGGSVAEAVVRGQYEGYRQERNVAPGSTTETYVALKLLLSSDRWQGVPFYLRTGKKLGKSITEISLHYKKPKVCYPTPAAGGSGQVCLFNEAKVLRNVLAIRIQPDEGISLRLMVKKPGFGMTLAKTQMEFGYGRAFPNLSAPEAYEKLLLDAIRGDQTLFARTDGIEASWIFVTKILEGFRKYEVPIETYKPGTPGPSGGDKLLEKDGRHWFLV